MVIYLKNGSKIHIKKKNRGSFTRWCGGNVTNECIRRGKNSSNPKIRKKATFAANARRWKHKNGGVLKAQEGIELPEVVITPSADDKQVLLRLKEMIPNQNLRRAFLSRLDTTKGYTLIYDPKTEDYSKYYNYTLTDNNDYVNRLYYLWDLTGRPKIKHTSENIFEPIIGNRPMTNPLTDTIYLSEQSPSLEAELSHFVQYNVPEASNFGRISVFTNRPSDWTNSRGQTGYDDPSHYEYDAHERIEPELYKYLLGRGEYKSPFTTYNLLQNLKKSNLNTNKKNIVKTEGRPKNYGELW